MNHLEIKQLADGRTAVRRRVGLPVTSADIELARQVAPLEPRILAFRICSHVLDACIWLAFDEGFEPDDDEPLAVFYVDEIPLLRDASPELLRLIHEVKMTFGGGRVVAE